MPNQHAKLSPSAAGRWLLCTKAPEAEASCADVTSSYANEGTEAHDLLEKCIKLNKSPSSIDPDHHAAKTLEPVYEHLKYFLDNPNWTVLAETRVKLTEDCWGTADIIMFNTTGKLVVTDYKHGKGVEVHAEGNSQLVIYAAAAIKELAWMFPAPIEAVDLEIIQPRIGDGKSKSWQLPIQDLNSLATSITLSIADIVAGKTKYKPSAITCRWCKAKATCVALSKAALDVARATFTPVGMVDTPSPATAATLTLDQQLGVYEAKKMLIAFIDAVEKDLYDKALRGDKIPGYKLVAGRSIRKWIAGDEEIVHKLTKGCRLKLKDIAPPKLLGPARIEKMIDPTARNSKKKIELLKTIIHKPQGKPTLVHEMDKRPSIIPTLNEVVNPLG